MKTTVLVKCLTKRKDWATGEFITEQVPFIVDEDKKHVFENMTVKNMSKIDRDKSKHLNKGNYVLVASGYTRVEVGNTSIANWVFGIKPGTRRQKGFASNEFTREAFGIK